MSKGGVKSQANYFKRKKLKSKSKYLCNWVYPLWRQAPTRQNFPGLINRTN